MKYISYILVLLMLPLLSSTSSGTIQKSPEEVLDRIAKVHDEAAYLYQVLEYRLYRSATQDVPYSIEKGLYIKDGTNVYAVIGPVLSLTAGAYVVGIDEEDKLLVLSANSRSQDSQPVYDVLTQLPKGSKMTLVASSSETGILRLSAESGEIAQAEFFYDKEKFILRKVVLKYRREINLAEGMGEDLVQPVLEIVYTENKRQGTPGPKTKLSTYITRKSGEWKPTLAYRDYEFINNLDLQSDQK